ncbi:unnamed protein product [Staurois parvus]|uniref:Uncharacterized protein n=1 Tax=Staurois parvus TaxID=386267 RepID=A0ABN9AWQ9_9NEOB|nr:unnamed protein product [Staurois parvus]
MQSGNYHSPGNCQTHTRPLDFQTEKQRKRALESTCTDPTLSHFTYVELLLFPVDSTLL